MDSAPAALPGSTSPDRLYTRRFFQVFAAVVLFMTSSALLFHFGQYVRYVGGAVDTAGWIQSCAMIGTLMIRLPLGRWIDRFGGRPTWLLGASLSACAVLAMPLVHAPWLLAALRAINLMSAAAVMTTVAVFAAQIAPPRRRAESLGTIGLAGFLGMIFGPTIGDWVLAGAPAADATYRVFFFASAACAVLSALVILATPLPAAANGGRPDSGSARGQRSVVRRHWPGPVLLIAVVFLMAFCIPMLFLERLAEARGFENVKAFFLAYCPTAIILRVLCRRVPERLGRRPTMYGGMALIVAGLLSLTGVQAESGLILPAMLMGAGHCFVFPSMVDLAAERLPPQHRGTGTALVLGAGDVGAILGFAWLGEAIARLGYDAAILALAIVVAIVTTVALLLDLRRRRIVGPLPRERAADGERIPSALTPPMPVASPAGEMATAPCRGTAGA